MRASSAITTKSQHRAMSLPPATAGPCTHIPRDRSGLVGAPQGHKVLGVLIHHVEVGHRIPWTRRIVARRRFLLRARRGPCFSELDKIVAAAESLACTGQNDDVNVVVLIGERDGIGDLARHVPVDRIHTLRAVERNRAPGVPETA